MPTATISSEGFTVNTEGQVRIPPVTQAFPYVDEPLSIRASYVNEGWFNNLTGPIEKTFKVTLSKPSETTVTFLLAGKVTAPIIYKQQQSFKAQASVMLINGNVIVIPDDNKLGAWSLDSTGNNLGITINPATGEIDASKVDVDSTQDFERILK